MRTDIVVTDSSLGLIQDLLHRPIPLAEYLAGPDQSGIAVHFARDFGVRQMNFRFGYDGSSRQSYFDNREPKPGEPATYRNDRVVS